MFWTIVKKEFLGNLTSLRFMLTFLLVVSVFIVSGITFVGKYKEELADYVAISHKNLEGLQSESRALNLIPYYTQTVRKKPLATQLLAEGYEKLLPNTFRLDAFSLRYPEVDSRSNFLFPRFADIDWAFIIAFILSFVAVLMTFDSLSAEKQRGTLSLMMANAVARDKVILGKYLSGLLTISIPLLVGLLLSILIVSLGGVSLAGGGYIPKMLMFLLVSFFYLSLFVFLGLLVSSLASRSSSSIVVLLFIWVILTIIIPSFGRIAAEKLVRVPSRAEIDQQFQDGYRQIWENSSKFGDNAGNWGSGVKINPPARAALFNAVTELRNRIREDYLNKMIAQASGGKALTRISPTAIYEYASEAIVGTGISRFRSLYEQIKRYKGILRDFIIAKDKEDPQSQHLLAEWSGHRVLLSAQPVDFNAIPRFEEKEMPIGQAVRKAIVDIGILVLLNLFLAVGVYVSFLVMDVRQQ